MHYAYIHLHYQFKNYYVDSGSIQNLEGSEIIHKIEWLWYDIILQRKLRVIYMNMHYHMHYQSLKRSPLKRYCHSIFKDIKNENKTCIYPFHRILCKEC